MTNGNSELKIWTPCPAIPLSCPALTSCAYVTPAYFGRLAAKSPWLRNKPKMNNSTAEPMATPARAVTILCRRRVGWITTQKIRARTTIEAMKPGQLVITPACEYQLFAFSKKELPVPTPMMRPLTWKVRRTTGISNATMASEANTSVNDSTQPTKGPILGMKRLVKT